MTTKLFIAGHNGMVGRAISSSIKHDKRHKLIVRNRDDLDLKDYKNVLSFFKDQKPESVIIAAAKVGGIHANSKYPADFIFENLQIQNTIIHAAHEANIQKILFLGSSCIYPKFSKQPIKENYLLTGTLEKTNEPYAIAKIAGIKLCQSYNAQYGRDYRAVMPTNLYGPGDNYHPLNSHVVPGLIHRFHHAKMNKLKVVNVWGDGKAKRELCYVEDMADICLRLFNLTADQYYKACDEGDNLINVGSGQEYTIAEIAEHIKFVVGFKGEIAFDASMPNGTPRKLLDTSKMNSLGIFATTDLVKGLQKTYDEFCKSI